MQFDDRVQAVADFGFTRRQARFLVTVMLHSGVCLQRQYTAFAGIVHGQKTRKFFAKLVRRRYARAFPCRHNRGHVYQVHCKALYRAIGQTDSRHRRPLSPARVVHGLMLLDAVLAEPQLVWLATDKEKAVHLTTLTRIEPDRLPSPGIGKPPAVIGRVPFEKFPIGINLNGRAVLLYLATDSEVGRFRAFMQRHFEVLRSLPAWTLRIVASPWPIGLGELHAKTAQDDLTRTLRPALMASSAATSTSVARSLTADTSRQIRSISTCPNKLSSCPDTSCSTVAGWPKATAFSTSFQRVLRPRWRAAPAAARRSFWCISTVISFPW
jgi:hypothetical protein